MGIIGPKFAEIDHDLILGRVQDEINRLYGVAGKPQSTALVAKQIMQKQGDTQARMQEILAKRRMGGTPPKS
jgi:hypothetical protein